SGRTGVGTEAVGDRGHDAAVAALRPPRVSVCIDVHDYEVFLPEAIESVLRQDFEDFEVVVVDDQSSDGSFDVARRYAAADPRVAARPTPATLGMVGNRNACLRAARGEYVKILHADDFLCRPDALRALVAAFEAVPAMSLVACAL